MVPHEDTMDLNAGGCEAFAAGRLTEAEALFDLAREHDPQEAQTHLNLGILYLVQGRLQEAIAALAESIRRCPLSAAGYFAIGLTLSRQGAHALARAFFARSLQCDPRYPGARERWQAEAGPDMEQAERLAPLAELLELHPLPTLSVCLIVKDEEQFLPHCLERVQSIADQIVVVDTGSTDATVAIAEDFGARVIHHPWRQDFAEARNVSLAHATGEWILVLDADELMEPDSHWELQSLLWNRGVIGWNLVIENLVGQDLDQGSNVFYAFRLFQNGFGLHFVGEVHEQVLPSAAQTGLPQGFSGVRVVHYGYLQSVLEERGKGQRNLELSLHQTEREPENPYAHYQLGNTYRHIGNHAEAVAAYEWALQLVRADELLNLPYAPHLYFGLAESCRLAGRPREAIDACRRGAALFPDYPDLVYTQAYVEMEQDLLADSEVHFRRCLAMEEKIFSSGTVRGTTSYLAWNALGAVYFRMGRPADAEEALQHALQDRPRNFIDPLTNLGKLYLHQERWSEALQRFTEALEVQPLDAQSWQNSARALLLLGYPADAETALRQGLALEPDRPESHYLLGQALLQQRRYAEAAEAFQRELVRTADHLASQNGLEMASLLECRAAAALTR